MLMKIFRALGLLIFILIAQSLLSDVFNAFIGAAVASLNVIESAALLSIEQLESL